MSKVQRILEELNLDEKKGGIKSASALDFAISNYMNSMMYWDANFKGVTALIHDGETVTARTKDGSQIVFTLEKGDIILKKDGKEIKRFQKKEFMNQYSDKKIKQQRKQYDKMAAEVAHGNSEYGE